uniref:Cilia- and flagella-associated protein 206 n=1 Tax=Anas platyrhynchos TaxID=8839 RepID=A0A8B9ZG75_ANAPL
TYPTQMSPRVIKLIIRQVGEECAAKGQAVSETLVAFMVKAVVLDPRNEFNVDQILTKRDVQNLIQLCVTRLLDTTNPSLSTIKMQVYFDMDYANRAELLREQRRVLEGRLAPLVRDITDSRPRVPDEMMKVYQMIVSYVLLSSGLGSPTDIEVVREATAALQSIFPQTALSAFISFSKKDKEQQLKNLTMLVTGIRLFNRECGNGGKGIDDLPAILNEVLPSATRTMEDSLNTCHVLAHCYTALLESMHEDQHRHRQLSSFKLKEALFNVRQYEAFLCILMSDAITGAQEVEKMNVQFATTMEQLKNIVQNKVSVDTKDVFPLFVAICNVWTGFQNELLLLSFLSNMTNNLQQFLEAQSQLFPEEVLTSLLEGVTELHVDFLIIKISTNQEWLFPETTADFDQLLIQYHGFCAYAIGVKGLTLPGNPAIGILKHKDRCYVFKKAKEHAELIHLLELHHHFEYLAPYTQTRSADKSLMKPTTKHDSSTQTDTHILPPSIVKSYEWNEWELRRKAIKLANLRRKLTHAMQTDLSHLRRENSTQVYLPKDVSTQTKHENSSNVPRPQIFLAGLRGGSSAPTRMVKVDLTRPIDET